jgi:hypothetical protein
MKQRSMNNAQKTRLLHRFSYSVISSSILMAYVRTSVLIAKRRIKLWKSRELTKYSWLPGSRKEKSRCRTRRLERSHEIQYHEVNQQCITQIRMKTTKKTTDKSTLRQGKFSAKWNNFGEMNILYWA